MAPTKSTFNSNATAGGTAGGAALIDLRGISYAYGQAALRAPILSQLQLRLNRGAFACLMGPSGSGKTTLLNILGLLQRPDAGTYLLNGRSTESLPESELEKIRLTEIGFVFQSFYLLPTLSVLENTQYFLPLLGVGSNDSRQRAEAILVELGLQDHLHKKPGQLSGGQRQRVAIARALVKNPKLVLADEPTANLDAATADTIIKAFSRLQQERGTAFLFATHDQHLQSYARQIFQLKGGQLAELPASAEGVNL